VTRPMTVIPIENGSESEAKICFLRIGRIIETSIDKTTDSGIGTGDDISSSALSHGLDPSDVWL